MDVAAWLRRLGLEQYAPAFRDNAVDGEVREIERNEKRRHRPLLHRVIVNYDMERYRRLLYRSVVPAIIRF